MQRIAVLRPRPQPQEHFLQAAGRLPLRRRARPVHFRIVQEEQIDQVGVNPVQLPQPVEVRQPVGVLIERGRPVRRRPHFQKIADSVQALADVLHRRFAPRLGRRRRHFGDVRFGLHQQHHPGALPGVHYCQPIPLRPETRPEIRQRPGELRRRRRLVPRNPRVVNGAQQPLHKLLVAVFGVVVLPQRRAPLNDAAERQAFSDGGVQRPALRRAAVHQRLQPAAGAPVGRRRVSDVPRHTPILGRRPAGYLRQPRRRPLCVKMRPAPGRLLAPGPAPAPMRQAAPGPSG